MPLDFSPLQTIDPTGAFYRGQEAARAEQERNMLRAAQMEQMQYQRENMLAQRQERQALAQKRLQDEEESKRRREALNRAAEIIGKAGATLDLPTLNQGLEWATKSGDKNAVDMLSKLRQDFIAEQDYQREAERLGLRSGAAPAGAAPTGAMAPANALAPTPAEPSTASMNALAAPAEAAASPPSMSRSQIQQMLMSPNARIREQGKALVQTLEKTPEPTAGMREYQEAVRQGFKGTFMEYKQQLQPKPAQVSIKLPEQQKAFEAELGKGQAKKLLDDKAVAEDAASIIGTVQQGRQLLQSGMITGFGAEALTQIGKALNQVGISFAADEVANTEAFAANMAQNVGRIIKQFGAGTGLSNADREYAEKMAGGKITLDRKAIERILDINERAARNVITAHNKRAGEVKTNVPLTVEIPAQFAPPAPPPTRPATGRPSLDQIFKLPKG